MHVLLRSGRVPLRRLYVRQFSHSNYWQKTASPPITTQTTATQTTLPAKVDVVVIGGGFYGLSTALELASQGVSVAVVEQSHVGQAASGQNAGMVLPGLAVDASVLLERYGETKAKELFQSSLNAKEHVVSVTKRHGIDCDLQPARYLVAAAKPKHMKGLLSEHELLQRTFNYETTMRTRNETKFDTGSEWYGGGIMDTNAVSVHPYKLATGLAAAAVNSGAVIVESTTVNGVRRGSNNKYTVETSQGNLSCDQVVLATNAFTPQQSLSPTLKKKIFALGSYIIVTEPLPSTLRDSICRDNLLVANTLLSLHYFRKLPDHRLLFGGRAAFKPGQDDRSMSMLRDEMTAVFPTLANVKIDYMWGGMLDVARDKMIHTGVQDGGIHYALGFCGHGVAMATYLGKVTADKLLGKPDASPFTHITFPSIPTYRGGKPWFLPILGEAIALADLLL